MITKKKIDNLLDLSQKYKQIIYWSRRPGEFVNKISGASINDSSLFFDGTILDWYYTLAYSIQEVMGKKTKSPNLATSPDIAIILEHLVYYRPNLEENYNDPFRQTGTLIFPNEEKNKFQQIKIFINNDWNDDERANKILFVPNNSSTINNCSLIVIKGIGLY